MAVKTERIIRFGDIEDDMLASYDCPMTEDWHVTPEYCRHCQHFLGEAGFLSLRCGYNSGPIVTHAKTVILPVTKEGLVRWHGGYCGQYPCGEVYGVPKVSVAWSEDLWLVEVFFFNRKIAVIVAEAIGV